MATQATPEEYRRIDKWRCNVANECVAQFRKLDINKQEPSRKSTPSVRSTPSVKEDRSLVIYKSRSHDKIFEDFDSYGKPITVIRRYKSQKGSPSPVRKSDSHVVHVTEDPSSSSNSSRHVANERRSAYRTEDRRTRYRHDDDRSQRSLPGRRHRESVGNKGSGHRRHRSEFATVTVPVRRSAVPAVSAAPSRKDTLRKMLRLSTREIRPLKQDSPTTREDAEVKQSETQSRYSESESRTAVAKSIDGRGSQSVKRTSRRGSETRGEDLSLRSQRTRESNSRSHDSSRRKSAHHDHHDSRRHRRSSSASRLNARDYSRRNPKDYRSSYNPSRSMYASTTLPRRSKTVNRGSTYDNCYQDEPPQYRARSDHHNSRSYDDTYTRNYDQESRDIYQDDARYEVLYADVPPRQDSFWDSNATKGRRRNSEAYVVDDARNLGRDEYVGRGGRERGHGRRASVYSDYGYGYGSGTRSGYGYR